jgi:hypothetical protein
MQNLGPIYKTKNVYSLMFTAQGSLPSIVVASQIADSQFAESQIAESN